MFIGAEQNSFKEKKKNDPFCFIIKTKNKSRFLIENLKKKVIVVRANNTVFIWQIIGVLGPSKSRLSKEKSY